MSQSINFNMDPRAYRHLPSEQHHAPVTLPPSANPNIRMLEKWLFRATAVTAAMIMFQWLIVNIVIQAGNTSSRMYENIQNQILGLSNSMYTDQSVMLGFALILGWYAETRQHASAYMMSSIYNFFILLVWIGFIEKGAGFQMWSNKYLPYCFDSPIDDDKDINYYCRSYKAATMYSFFLALLHTIWMFWHGHCMFRIERVTILDSKIRVFRIITAIVVFIHIVAMLALLVAVETENPGTLSNAPYPPPDMYFTIACVTILAGYTIAPSHTLAVIGCITCMFTSGKIFSYVILQVKNELGSSIDNDTRTQTASVTIFAVTEILGGIILGLAMMFGRH